MCGIAGIIHTDNQFPTLEVLKKMSKSLAHRGPDAVGQFIDEKVGFAHTRLAILDLSKLANQPMISENKNHAISYNGEIYNFQEIKEKLIKKNHIFKSNSDTEVVLRSWIEWGENCVNHFNGMFAFSIYDKKEKKVFLVRDRYGIKPLYLGIFDGLFIFGSEQKAILCHPKIQKNLDFEGIFEYFTFQNIFTEKTFLKNIQLLPAGSITTISLQTNSIHTKKYWDFNFSDSFKNTEIKDVHKELEELINNAVKRQLLSDVEIGTYLSGGIDSGTISAIASSKISNLKSFTCGFDLSSASGIELGFDERDQARSMSDNFGTDHYDYILNSGDMEKSLPILSHHIEEPRVGQSYPNFYAAKLASNYVKVVLSGVGGDEVFGGYPWRYLRAFNYKNFEDYIDEYYLSWQRLVDNRDLKKMFKPIQKDVEHVWTRNIFKDIFKDYKKDLKKPEDFINHSLYFESKTFLHGLLVIEDKISMAHSLETRVPFLDNDLVDFAMKCPVTLKIKDLTNKTKINENDWSNKRLKYFQKTNDGKQILREVMSKYIPENIIKAKKQGFSSPDASWFRGESINFVKRELIERDAIIYNFLDKESVLNLVAEHLDGKKNRRLLIWSLLNTEHYLRDLFD